MMLQGLMMVWLTIQLAYDKRLFTFSFLVSPSLLQKRKSAPRNDGCLEERLWTTWGYENKINEKRLLSDSISGTQKSFPLSLHPGASTDNSKSPKYKLLGEVEYSCHGVPENWQNKAHTLLQSHLSQDLSFIIFIRYIDVTDETVTSWLRIVSH